MGRGSPVASGISSLGRRIVLAASLLGLVLGGAAGCGEDTDRRMWSSGTSAPSSGGRHTESRAPGRSEPTGGVPAASPEEWARTQHSSERTVGGGTSEGRPARAPEPVVADARSSSLRVRVGEPVEIRIRVENRGGPARRGTLSVFLVEHPPMRLGYRSGLPVRFVEEDRSQEDAAVSLRGPANAQIGAEIRAEAQNWRPGEGHGLHLKMIPAEAGTILLYYRARLEGVDGIVATYPVEAWADGARPDGRGVAIQVTRTMTGPRE